MGPVRTPIVEPLMASASRTSSDIGGIAPLRRIRLPKRSELNGAADEHRVTPLLRLRHWRQ